MPQHNRLRNIGKGVLIALLASIGPALVLPACNTIEGAGEDIESAGEAIDEEAEEAN